MTPSDRALRRLGYTKEDSRFGILERATNGFSNTVDTHL